MDITEKPGTTEPTPENTSTAQQLTPRKKAPPRMRRNLPSYTGPKLDLSSAAVSQVPLNDLNLDDTTFQIRATTKPETLVDSIRSVGVLVPLVARPHPAQIGTFQLISGFHRAQAAIHAGLETVPVVIRDFTDTDALVFAYTDNERRKTLDDLDRANAMRKLRESGDAKTTRDVARLFRISERQVQRLEGLLETPEQLRLAIADPESNVSSTHALVLNQAMRAHPDPFPLDRWLSLLRSQPMSVADLKRTLRGERVKAGWAHDAIQVSDKKITIDRRQYTTLSGTERSNLLSLLHNLLADDTRAPDIDVGAPPG